MLEANAVAPLLLGFTTVGRRVGVDEADQAHESKEACNYEGYDEEDEPTASQRMENGVRERAREGGQHCNRSEGKGRAEELGKERIGRKEGRGRGDRDSKRRVGGETQGRMGVGAELRRRGRRVVEPTRRCR